MVQGVRITGVVTAVGEAIRARVLAGDLAGGEALTESRVADEFGVARPTAKAAIESLVAEGLLERTAHRTARVRILDAASVRDVYQTRRRIESEAIRELASVRAVIADARDADREIARHPGGSSIAIVEADIRFHSAIVDAIGSERTSRAYRALVGEVRLCMARVQGHRLVTADSIHSEHEAILDHIARGEADAAIEALRGHLDRAQERLVNALEP